MELRRSVLLEPPELERESLVVLELRNRLHCMGGDTRVRNDERGHDRETARLGLGTRLAASCARGLMRGTELEPTTDDATWR
mgnify:CR=1 FL=1